MATKYGSPVYRCKKCGSQFMGAVTVQFTTEEEARMELNVRFRGNEPLHKCEPIGVYGLTEVVGMCYR